MVLGDHCEGVVQPLPGGSGSQVENHWLRGSRAPVRPLRMKRDREKGAPETNLYRIVMP